MKRLIIYPKDVAVILGKSENTSQIILRTLRDALQKEKHQYITIREFCDYHGLPYDEVVAMINEK